MSNFSVEDVCFLWIPKTVLFLVLLKKDKETKSSSHYSVLGITEVGRNKIDNNNTYGTVVRAPLTIISLKKLQVNRVLIDGLHVTFYFGYSAVFEKNIT